MAYELVVVLYFESESCKELVTISESHTVFRMQNRFFVCEISRNTAQNLCAIHMYET